MTLWNIYVMMSLLTNTVRDTDRKKIQEENMKKLLSLLLVVSMVLALGIVAGAADDTNTNPTTYLQINNDDVAGSAGINFLVNNEKVTAQGTYRIFANVCFENVVATGGGSAYVNIYFYNEAGEYLGHKDWASSNEAKAEEGEWGLYELNFSPSDYEGFSYATVGVGLWMASGTVKAASIKISQNNEMMWTRSFSADFDLNDPTEVASTALVDYTNEGVVWEVIRPEQDLTGYKNLCREEGVEIKIVGGANEGATNDPNVVTGQYSGCLNDGILGVTEFVPEWFGFNAPCYITNATIEDQTGNLGKILVDLGDEKDFNRIRLHYWGPLDHNGGIGDAKIMRALYSNDGENWTEFADLLPDNEVGFGWGDSDVRDSVTARYVLVEYLYAGGGWGMVSEIEVLSPEAIPDESSAPAEESKPVDESKGGTTEPTSDSGFIALALIASLAVAGAVVIKKSR